jgi:hypothetical protein
MAETLSVPEQEELAKAEATIAGGWPTFLDVGRALASIRDHRLYRHGYKTFEQYCQSRWQYGRANAYRLIAAAETMRTLSPFGDKLPLPQYEAQIRPLTGLKPQEAKSAWENAVASVDGGLVTARVVAKAAAAFRPPVRESPEGPKAKAGPVKELQKLTRLLVGVLAQLDVVAQRLKGGSRGRDTQKSLQSARAKIQMTLNLIHPGGSQTNRTRRQKGTKQPAEKKRKPRSASRQPD